jgi:hypothetical protein
MERYVIFLKGFIDDRLGMRELWSGELSFPMGGLGRSCQTDFQLTIAMSRVQETTSTNRPLFSSHTCWLPCWT